MSSAALKVSTSLSALAAQIESFAKTEFAKGEAEVSAFVNKAVEVTEEVVEAAEPVVEQLVELEFEAAVTQFGPLASALVKNLMGVAGAALGGTEKANLSATQLVQAAANQGYVLADQDVTALIKNSYIAVKNLVESALGIQPATA